MNTPTRKKNKDNDKLTIMRWQRVIEEIERAEAEMLMSKDKGVRGRG